MAGALGTVMLHFWRSAGVGGGLTTLLLGADRGEGHLFRLRDLLLAPAAAPVLEESQVPGQGGCRVGICPRSGPEAGPGCTGLFPRSEGALSRCRPPACTDKASLRVE